MSEIFKINIENNCNLFIFATLKFRIKPIMLGVLKANKILIITIDFVIIIFTILSIYSISNKPRLTEKDIIINSNTSIEEVINISSNKINHYSYNSSINLENITDFMIKGEKVLLSIVQKLILKK